MNLATALRWLLIMLCAFAIGPACATILRHAQDADGGHAVSMLIGESMSKVLLGGLLVFAGAAVVGWLGAHFFSLSTGFACAGLVVAWGAWNTGTLDALVRRTQSATSLTTLGAEGAIVLVLSAAITMLMWAASAKRQPAGASPHTPGAIRAGGVLGMFVGPATAKSEAPKPGVAAMALATAAIVGAGMAYLLAISPLKGQAVLAALGAAIAGGLAAQFVASSMNATVAPTLVVVAMIVPALLGMLIHGSDVQVVTDLYAARSMPLSRIMPMDWAAGALLGAPVGLGWAGAMIDARMV